MTGQPRTNDSNWLGFLGCLGIGALIVVLALASVVLRIAEFKAAVEQLK